MKTWNTIKQQQKKWVWVIAEYLPRPIVHTLQDRHDFLIDQLKRKHEYARQHIPSRLDKPLNLQEIRELRIIEDRFSLVEYPDGNKRERGRQIAHGCADSLKKAREDMEQCRLVLAGLPESSLGDENYE